MEERPRKHADQIDPVTHSLAAHTPNDAGTLTQPFALSVPGSAKTPTHPSVSPASNDRNALPMPLDSSIPPYFEEEPASMRPDFWRLIGIGAVVGGGIFGLIGAIVVALILSQLF